MKHQYKKTFDITIAPKVPDSKDPAFYIKFADQPLQRHSDNIIYELQQELPAMTMGVHARKNPFSPKRLQGDILVVNHKNVKDFKKKIIKIMESYSCSSVTFQDKKDS